MRIRHCFYRMTVGGLLEFDMAVLLPTLECSSVFRFNSRPCETDGFACPARKLVLGVWIPINTVVF